MIFRRRRVRIEMEENTLTLGIAGASVSAAPAAPVEAEVAMMPSSIPLLHQPGSAPDSSVETRPKSIPKGNRHVL